MVAEDLRRQNACALVGSLDNISKLNFFQIRMLLRLTPLLGGDKNGPRHNRYGTTPAQTFCRSLLPIYRDLGIFKDMSAGLGSPGSWMRLG